MATEVRVPTTGNAGEPAVVLEWTVAVGDQVQEGQVVVSLETAKAVIDVDAPVDGVVLDTRFESGDDAPEHAVLLIIGAADEAIERPAEPPAPDAATPAQAVEQERAAAPEQEEYAAPLPRKRISISPRARRHADARGVDVTTVTGTGPFGRIVIADIDAAAEATAPEPVAQASHLVAPAQSQAPPFAAVPAGAHVSGTTQPVRGPRRVTAQRMHASLQNTAQVTLTRYARADGLLAYASRLKEATHTREAPKIGINDLVLFAVARTVGQHPEANSWFSWEGITQFTDVDLGFAVDTGRALLVPVIRQAQSLSLAALAARAHDAIDRARAGALTNEEMQGGTFTVSNLGSAGIHWFTPVLNTPQSCILGVGAVHQSHPDAAPQLPLSLTFDHQALDGAAAATLLADLATAIEYVDTVAAL